MRQSLQGMCKVHHAAIGKPTSTVFLCLLYGNGHTSSPLTALAVACAEKGILSLWSQMFAEFLAITWMLDHEAGVKKSLPVFGGDFNDHMIMHQPSSHVLHFMKHDPDDAGKQCAVICMRHLLKQANVLLLETGKSFYFCHVIRAFAHSLWGQPIAALHPNGCLADYVDIYVCQKCDAQHSINELESLC